VYKATITLSYNDCKLFDLECVVSFDKLEDFNIEIVAISLRRDS